MIVGLQQLFGWDGLTAAERAGAVYGAAGGLLAVLVARVLFGGRGRR